MAELKRRSAGPDKTASGHHRIGGDSFVIDGAYLRAQAQEAIAIFFAPFSGVIAAARGRTRSDI